MTKIFIALFFSLTLTGFAQHKPAFKFEKLIFHTTGCFGTCPTYHLELDKNKVMKLHAEKVFKDSPTRSFQPDSEKIGYFTSSLPDTLYHKLINELQNLGLDTLNFPDIDCCDGSLITIIVYYNGKRNYLRSMFPPKQANDLILLLYDICKGSKQRSTKKFEIEHPKTG